MSLEKRRIERNKEREWIEARKTKALTQHRKNIKSPSKSKESDEKERQR